MKAQHYHIPNNLRGSLQCQFYEYLYQQYPHHHRNDFMSRDGFLLREITVLDLNGTTIIQISGSPAKHEIIVREKTSLLVINGHSTKRTRKQMGVIKEVLSFAHSIERIPQLVT